MAVPMVVIVAVSSSTTSKDPKDASYFKITQAFTVRLERPCYNMVHGHFGGGYGVEQICVQSMDGQLTVLEQERVLHERKLSKFLLPGPLAYVAKSDMLITYSSRMEVECYKYSTFSSLPAQARTLGAPACSAHQPWARTLGAPTSSAHQPWARTLGAPTSTAQGTPAPSLR